MALDMGFPSVFFPKEDFMHAVLQKNVVNVYLLHTFADREDKKYLSWNRWHIFVCFSFVPLALEDNFTFCMLSELLRDLPEQGDVATTSAVLLCSLLLPHTEWAVEMTSSQFEFWLPPLL